MQEAGASSEATDQLPQRSAAERSGTGRLRMQAPGAKSS